MTDDILVYQNSSVIRARAIEAARNMEVFQGTNPIPREYTTGENEGRFIHVAMEIPGAAKWEVIEFTRQRTWIHRDDMEWEQGYGKPL